MAETSLAKHMREICCKVKIEKLEQPDVIPKNMTGREFKRAARYKALEEEVSDDDAREILSKMQDDAVTGLVKADPCLWKFFLGLCNKYSTQKNGFTTISQKVRNVARFLLHCRLQTDLHSVADLLKVENFLVVMKQLKSYAGIQNDKSLRNPSKAKSGGEALLQCADRVLFHALMDKDKKLIEEITNWMSLFSKEFPNVSRIARDTLKERKYNNAAVLPLFKDIEKLDDFLNNNLDPANYSDTEESYIRLASICLAKTLLFNRRRTGEVSSITVETFLRAIKNRNSELNPDIYATLDDISKEMVNKTWRIEFVGKKRGNGYVLLTDEMKDAMVKLVAMRDKYVDATVPFLFARRGKCETPLRGYEVLEQLALEAKVSNAKLFKSIGLRKHLATMSHSLHLVKHHQEDLAVFMGHRLDVHKDVYRLPMDVIQRSKIAQILLRINSNKADDLRGKALDEIDENYDLVYAEDDEVDGMSSIDAE